MALTERLQILVTADAKGAAREFDKIGAAADRSLGRADDRLNKIGASLTSFGTQTVLAAGVAGAGLFEVAESASAYGEQVSRATKVFGDEALPVLEEFAKGAAETAGISQTAALQASSTFAAFGKQIGLSGKPLAEFSTGLTQLAGDFSSLQDIGTEEALTVFISALSGEQDAIKRYGIDLSAARVEQEALRLELADTASELTNADKVQARYNLLLQEGELFAGDFVDTSDSLANRQRELAAEFDNAKVALGEGLLPFAESAIGTVSTLTGAFNSLSESNQQTVGTFAGWATVGAGVAGSLALVGGQAIKLRESLYPVGADGTRSLTRLGRAAAGAGAAFAALAGIDIIAAVANDITDATEKTSDALADLLTQADATSDSLIVSFGDLADRIGGEFRLSDAWEDFGRTFRLSADGTKQSIESVDEAFDKILQASPAAANQLIADFKAAADAAAEGSQEQRDYQELFDRYKDKVQDKKDADVAAVKAQRQYNDEVADAAGLTSELTSELGDLSGEADGAADSLGDLGKNLENAVEPLIGLADAQESYSDALSDIEDAQRDVDEARANMNASAEEEADRLRDIEDAARDVDDAYRSLFDAQRNIMKERRDLARIDEDLAEANAELADITPGTVEYDDQAEEVQNLTRRREDAAFSLESALLREQDAQRGIQDALRDQADTYRDVNESKSEGSDAARDLADAEERLEDATRSAAGEYLALQTELFDVITKFDEQGLSVEDAKDALLEWAAQAPPQIRGAVEQMVADLTPLFVLMAGVEEKAKALTNPGQYGAHGFNYNTGSRDGRTNVSRTGIGAGLAGPLRGGTNIFGQPNQYSPSGRSSALDWWYDNYGGGRATGGRVSDDMLYLVNERGPEMFAPDSPGFVLNANDTASLIGGVEALLNQVGNSRSGMTLEQGAITVVAPGPEQAAEATIRKMRSAEFLFGGVR